MPLSSGKSKEAFSHNVEVEMEAGKPQKQAVAIAYSKQREANDIDIDTSEGKITRDAFVFMKGRKPYKTFAQCKTCAFFNPAIERCENFGPDNAVKARGSCGVYGYGPGNTTNLPQSRITPCEAGYVERPVRCEDCRFFDPIDEPQTHCDLFTQLALMQPGVWDLDRYVNAEDCCNANTEGARDPNIFGPLGPIPHANVTAGDEAPELPQIEGTPNLAMDRAPSMRTKDVDGRLHVRDCNVSKANVCPYIGHEIPDWETLGLEKDRVYYLYRDPAALAEAATTMERVPLMMRHVASTALRPQKETIVGTVSNVRWVAPYLRADLTVWDAVAIQAVESERQCELSPGYRYTPIMESGVTPEGDRFDGRMAGPIIFNHLALVDTGRTGPDVVVNDSAT